MSGHEDADESHRQKAPYTARNPIPTIRGFRQEKEARREEARDYGHSQENVRPAATNGQQQADAGADDDRQADEEALDKVDQSDNGEQAIDTSERNAAASDPKARRKELKQRKDERAEREVTDPVTHLPVKIHDLTSAALKEIPENDEAFGTTTKTATGLSNKSKSGKQLQEEIKHLQGGLESMQALFPPPDFDAVKEELASINKLGVTVGLVGTAAILTIAAGLDKLFRVERLARFVSAGSTHWIIGLGIWVLLYAIAAGAIVILILGVRDWMSKRIDSVWEDEIWESKRDASKRNAKAHETETVVWLNSLMAAIWPLINPDLFISLADTLEDVMQASLPRMVQMVSVNDIGQGSESIRILGIRWLPTGAAARSVTEQGKLKQPNDTTNHESDRKVPGQGEIEGTDDDQKTPKSNGADKSKGEGGEDKKDDDKKGQQGDDGAQQQIAEGLEAEEGDFVNMEIAFAYRARSNKHSIKERAKDMHLYIAFYLPGNLKVPVWVDLRGVVGTMRLRLQLTPDPPFFALCTLTFLGQPKVQLHCTPLSRHALNIMDVPLISNFVQSAIDAAMAEYVAPKSLNLDLKEMLAGDDFKKDTNTRGVLVVNIKRGYDFKEGDPGIPLIQDASSDPYVSVGWAKFGKPVWSTRLLLKEMEPWWDETAYLLVTPEELNVSERVRLQLWDSDRLTADDDLGRIEVDLKDLMKRSESNGRMWTRTDGFKALKAGESMPGKLEWSVGYFSKTRIQECQFQKQTFDTGIRSMDQLRKKVDETCQRKLREAAVKKGRQGHDADELEQQKAQEMKRMQDAMMISAPPPNGYSSGIFSIQIHQITGLELENVSKTSTDKAKEGYDEQEEGEGLPSAYCTVIINHQKVFKTRTKPKNARPFYNAGTERFIADWHHAEVYISVRDARIKEDDALLGIIHLPLGEVFEERSQINGFYPLTGGVGYGRIRLSMVWRSVQLQSPVEALGWDLGTVEIQPTISHADVPQDLQRFKLKFYTDLGSAKMYPGKDRHGWATKHQHSLKLPVQKRYASCLAIQFRHHGTFHDKVPAFAVLWLKYVADDDEREITVPVWKGDYERAIKNDLPESGEKIGTLTLKLTFWNGLGAAHSRWARKNDDLQDVVEVLEVAHDNYEATENEKKVGVVDGNATDSSDDGNDSDDGTKPEANGDDHEHKGLKEKAKDFKRHQQGLNRHHRGLMQWKIPRTANWAKHKVEHAESKVTSIFKHHTRQAGLETEV